MKKIFTLTIIALLFSYIGKAQVFTSDFESWTGNVPANWVGAKTSLEADSISPYTTSVHGGTYACKLVNRESTHKRFTTQAVSITSGNVYTITFWVRGHGNIRTGLFDGGTTYTYNSYIVVNSSSWAQQTQSISAGNTSAAAEFIFSVQSTFADKDDIQIDDVTITTGAAISVPIHDIQYSTASPADSPYNNQVVSTGGIVTGKISTGFFMQSGSGMWNGIMVYDSIAASTLSRGDSVTLNAMVTEYYNMTELKTVTNLVKVSTGNAEPAPYPITGANSSDEGTEGVLVKITNGPCNMATNTYGVWAMYDTDSTYVDNLMYYFSATVGTHYDVTGVNYLSYGIYYVEPRDANDIQVSSGIPEYENNSINIFPNPVSSVLTVNNIEGVDQIRISNILGQSIQNIAVTGNQSEINVSSLPKGIYFISLLNKNTVVETKKFCKE